MYFLGFYESQYINNIIASKISLRQFFYNEEHSRFLSLVSLSFRCTKKENTLIAYPELERERYNARRANVK